ncbi:histidine ammonia-lyase, putative [Entamoeba histolytica HM-1:IMSS-B]|uniref:Histidine ammonia-lyase n=5 Tax=Entamoeba histolytica TaxID=5759 RepID=C4M8F4_ENTH1|nr:hypothetical protein EHI_036510 [Entamoeba histolytica HM-1:IMSS]EMH73224.1 histidine ammonia-lyase, putative [Entamoeba histolytica HM-1:IMSS-B]EMS16274.1 histidine ammonia-lyase, putative [Entamoeba histolytica HM-3:IMSS]ENY60863.1 histidine ammonia-lyase, putative [Entamoeba histolytica HM-1:IMSS-A]GAT97877.1 hypothetical protein CL6EHI_036510 [Entamoeba histolytica]EAL46185.2 hypothetical protein EHI_036510 [Entamoeba histolytica HM-1:IMSS]|eukprot:XP_651572.2 hypothetical protein EHI_036510 [Entamoeba histolytica HM-1:IMSS]
MKKQLHESIEENKEDEFMYLIDGFTMTPKYLLKGCQKPHQLYLHHTCLESIPQISEDTDINILEKFNERLDGCSDEILSPFKTRGILLLKMNAICRGNTPVQLQTIKLLQELYQKDILPIIPLKTKRSICNNTYHIAAIGKVLIGEGEVLYNNERKMTFEVFEKLQIKPIKMKTPEYKAFLEGNEMNVLTMINGNTRIWNCFNALVVGVFLGLIANNKITQPVDSSFFKQFTMKGPSRLFNLTKKLFRETKENEYKGIHQIQTDATVVDFICSFGRILEILILNKEMTEIELNSVRDQCFVVQRKEDIGTSTPLWGCGSYSGIIAYQITGVIKECILLAKRYSNLVDISICLPEEKEEEKEVIESPYENCLVQLKTRIDQLCKVIENYYLGVIQLDKTIIEKTPINDLFIEIKSIEPSILVDFIKYGDIDKLINEHHFNF